MWGEGHIRLQPVMRPGAGSPISHDHGVVQVVFEPGLGKPLVVQAFVGGIFEFTSIGFDGGAEGVGGAEGRFDHALRVGGHAHRAQFSQVHMNAPIDGVRDQIKQLVGEVDGIARV